MTLPTISEGIGYGPLATITQGFLTLQDLIDLTDHLAYFRVLPAENTVVIQPIPFPWHVVESQPVAVVVGGCEVAVLGNLTIDVSELL